MVASVASPPHISWLLLNTPRNDYCLLRWLGEHLFASDLGLLFPDDRAFEPTRSASRGTAGRVMCEALKV
jgi:hypothetical protein